MTNFLPIVDAHLDVARNALVAGRDLTLPVADIRAKESADHPAIAMTSLDGFSRAGVAVVVATLFASPASRWDGSAASHKARPAVSGYTTPQEAEATALKMLDLYNHWERAGRIRIITGVDSLEDHLSAFESDRVPGFIILMEGADPILSPDDLPTWFDRGVRLIGLAWGSTRYAGGTGASSGLTEDGRELLAGMNQLGIVHDASHLSEEAFWEAAALPHRGVCVTHASARSLMCRPSPPGGMPLNRFLSDQQIAEIGKPHGSASSGVIGVGMLNSLLAWTWEASNDRVTLSEHVAAHMRHISSIAGWTSVGIGSDVDAGHGRDQAPVELDGVEDWPLIGHTVPAEFQQGVLGGNWLRFFRETLPPRAI